MIAQAKREGWTVRGRERRASPARYSDIAVLMPTRATLPALDHGLDAAGIPARVESRMLIWNTAEVRDLLAVLSAISDPNDQVATVAALRSPGLACSDVDLATWRWRRRQVVVLVGRLRARRTEPSGVDGRCACSATSIASATGCRSARWCGASSTCATSASSRSPTRVPVIAGAASSSSSPRRVRSRPRAAARSKSSSPGPASRPSATCG